MEGLGKEILNTLSELTTERQVYEKTWQECFDLTSPERGEGFSRISGNLSINTKKRAELYTSTGTESVRDFATALMSSLTPANSKWFDLHVAGIKDKELTTASNVWLKNSSGTMFNGINASNYSAEGMEHLKDIATVGMAGLYIDIDVNGKLIYENWPLYNLYVQESTRNGGIDTVYRRLQLTPVQARNEFGLDNLPETTKEQLNTKADLNERDTYVHCIRPRLDSEGAALPVLAEPLEVPDMAFVSIYVHAKSGMVVKEGGFNEMPVIIPRWELIRDTSYANGPFHTALPDMKTLNELERIYLTNSELAINPPMVADSDGVLDQQKIKMGPRQVNYKLPDSKIAPLFTITNLNDVFVAIDRRQENVRRLMLADKIAPTEKKYASAQEIAQRQDIIRSLLGPIFGRFDPEYLDPMLDRVFGLQLRAGLFNEMPEEIKEANINPSFTGPHARAQKMERASVLMNFMNRLIEVAQIDKSVLNRFDFGEGMQRYGADTGIDQDLFRTQKQVEELDAQQEQEAMQMQQAQQQQGGIR